MTTRSVNPKPTRRHGWATSRFLRPMAGCAVLVLAGCASGDCDPSRAGLLDGIGCSAGGHYQQRQGALGQNLAATRADALESQADAARASMVAGDAQQRLADRRRRLAQMDAQSADLQRQMNAAALRDGTDQAALRQAQDELATLQRQRSQMNAQTSDAEIRRNEEQLAGVTAALRRMRGPSQ